MMQSGSNIRDVVRQGVAISSLLFDGISTWLFSVFVTIVVACVPIAIELGRSASVANNTLLTTTFVLAATFLVSAEHNIYRLCYAVIGLTTLVSDTLVLSEAAARMLDDNVWTLLGCVAGAHVIERFLWHVLENRPFPDPYGARS